MKKTLVLALTILLLAGGFLSLLTLADAFRAEAASIPGDGTGIKTNGDGTPWLDPSWHYRRPISIISTNGSDLLDNQVLVKLDNSNFDFSKANADGSDVRFTQADGLTEMSFWTESYSATGEIAYLWVKVPVIVPGENKIYLYYSNPAAVSASDGAGTFDFFDDDWGGITNEPCDTPGYKWCIRNGVPEVVTGVLKLTNAAGVSTTNAYKYQYAAVGYKANFDLSEGGIHGYEWGGFIDGSDGPRTMIRDLSSQPYDYHYLFLQNQVTSPINSDFTGDSWHGAFHIYEVRWQAGQSVGDIDHGVASVSSNNQVPAVALPITFYSYVYSTDVLWVDWVYVRQYHDAELSVTPGGEQGAVDLTAVQADSPDPLYRGEALTYRMTITNDSSIQAPGVVVTDTLPAGVQLATMETSQGTCSSSDVIVCSLGVMEAQATVDITAVVTTTGDGLITNTVTVTSPGYELNLGNNVSTETTNVLPAADLVISSSGYPAMVKPGDTLTYTLSITNTGPSAAEAVQVVDILPTGLEFMSASSPDCALDVGTVTCTVGKVGLNMEKEILIITTVQNGAPPTLTATASVSTTLTYDPQPANNTSVVVTEVDDESPVLAWQEPVENDLTPYSTSSGTVLLQVSATDNDKIDRVVFKLWDHFANAWVDIGTAFSPPYQAVLDTSLLKPRSVYQLFAYAYDPAGNFSRERILIERVYPIYLPLTYK